MFAENGVFSDTTIDYNTLFENSEYMDFLHIVIKYSTQFYLKSGILDKIRFLGKIRKLVGWKKLLAFFKKSVIYRIVFFIYGENI